MAKMLRKATKSNESILIRPMLKWNRSRGRLRPFRTRSVPVDGLGKSKRSHQHWSQQPHLCEISASTLEITSNSAILRCEPAREVGQCEFARGRLNQPDFNIHKKIAITTVNSTSARHSYRHKDGCPIHHCSRGVLIAMDDCDLR